MTWFRLSPSKLIAPFMWWTGLLMLYVPIFTLVAYSFVVGAGDGDINVHLSLEAYRRLSLDDRMMTALANSFFIAFFSATISMLLGGMAAFAMERGRPVANRIMNILTMAPLILPEVVFGLGLLIWFVFLRISLGSVSLILAHVTFSVSYVLMTVRGRVRLLDPAIDDAARDLGANPWQVFSRIQLPLMAPALIAGWMMSFTLSFDDFLISFFTSGPETSTLPIALYGIIKFGVSPEVFAMASCVFGVSFISASLVTKMSAAKFDPA